VLVAGDAAPEFTAPDQEGRPVRLADLRGGPVVLYFYPKAGTAGCTRESVAFAQLHQSLASKGVRIIGVSVDDVVRQKQFAEECALPFPLLSDASREIARSYGVLGAFGHAKRVTFLLGPDGRILEVVESMLPGPHIERARARWLGGAAPR
jgi:thioredoxin-dependent peroxiredoxin